MKISKNVVVIFFLCLVNVSLSKPTTTEYVTEGRGIGSTIWGWITYPFTWWSSSETEQPPVTDQLVASSTYSPYEDVFIGKPNITVWCNDQTCTTMVCGGTGCRNVTCNIYDTDMNGECREYITITKPGGYEPSQSTATMPTPHHKVTVAAPITLIEEHSIVTTTQKIQPTEERPLELEAVLSSTVTKVNN